MVRIKQKPVINSPQGVSTTPKAKTVSPKSAARKSNSKKTTEEDYARGNQEKKISKAPTESGKKVEKILDHKYDGKGLRFLVKWAGYPDNQSQWVSMAKMGCPVMIDEYLNNACEKKEQKRNATPKAKKAVTAPKVAIKLSVAIPVTPPVVTAPTAAGTSPRRTPKRKAAPLFECEILDQPKTVPKKKSAAKPRQSTNAPAQRKSSNQKRKSSGSEEDLFAQEEEIAQSPVKPDPPVLQTYTVGPSVSRAEDNMAALKKFAEGMKKQRLEHPMANVKIEGEQQGTSSTSLKENSGGTSRQLSESISNTSGGRQNVRVKIEEEQVSKKTADQQLNSNSEGGSVDHLANGGSAARPVYGTPSAPLKGISIKHELQESAERTRATANTRIEEIQEVREQFRELRAQLADAREIIEGVQSRQEERTQIYETLVAAEAEDRALANAAMDKIKEFEKRLTKIQTGR